MSWRACLKLRRSKESKGGLVALTGIEPYLPPSFLSCKLLQPRTQDSPNSQESQAVCTKHVHEQPGDLLHAIARLRLGSCISSCRPTRSVQRHATNPRTAARRHNRCY